jgi:hypothetical protein
MWQCDPTAKYLTIKSYAWTKAEWETKRKQKMRSSVIDVIECVVFWFISLSQTHMYWSIASDSLSLSPFVQGSMGQLCIYLKWTDDGTGRFTYTQLSRVHKQIKRLTDASRRSNNINFLPCVYLSEKEKKIFKLDLTSLLRDSSGYYLFSRACHLMITLPLTFFSCLFKWNWISRWMNIVYIYE